MDAVEYLEHKLNRKIRGRQPFYLGELRKHRELIPDAINRCRASLYTSLRRSDNAPLTAILGRFGVSCMHLFEEDYTVYEQMHIGASMFEAFMNGEELVFIERQSKSKRKDNPYFVYPTSRFRELVPKVTPVFTSTKPIPPISHIIQECKAPLIKRWGRKDNEEFQKLLDEPFVKSADILQSTGWQINSQVLEIIQSSHRDELAPEHLPDPRKLTGDARKDAQAAISKASANAVILEKAEALDGEIFYQYVDYDWRGRVYYKEHFLNFQSNDLARGLMKFAVAKPLGESGLFWLAVHTANSFNQSYSIDDIPEWCEFDYKSFLESQGLTDISVDKMTLEDRAKWTQENMDMILLTAEMGGLPDCEKPVSYLACCLEYKAMQGMQNPEWHFCALPIAVDGSNNGWQHLGAMLKDELTGSLVGMTPDPVPNDLYVSVAKEIVACYPDFFEERGMKMKHIRKGIAKRGTMTKAYSAGAATIADNMWNDVRQLGFDSQYNISAEDCKFLAEALVDAIKSVCPKPMEAMGFLQGMASELAVNQGDVIKWLSPSGFPVDQSYMRADDGSVRVTFDPPKSLSGYSGNILLSIIIPSDYPDKRKHASSISPNFVHSQDASHLALTIANWDGPFGAVHDSFSVHAGDIEELLVMIKEVFIDMYDSEDFLGDLARDLGVPDEPPATGGLNINEIADCDFFFA